MKVRPWMAIAIAMMIPALSISVSDAAWATGTITAGGASATSQCSVHDPAGGVDSYTQMSVTASFHGPGVTPGTKYWLMIDQKLTAGSTPTEVTALTNGGADGGGIVSFNNATVTTAGQDFIADQPTTVTLNTDTANGLARVNVAYSDADCDSSQSPSPSPSSTPSPHPTATATPSAAPITSPAGLALAGVGAIVGGRDTFTASGFQPGSQVNFYLHSNPYFLGTARANQAGVATLVTTLPAGFTGAHSIQVVGKAPDGSPLSMSQPITIKAAHLPVQAATGQAANPWFETPEALLLISLLLGTASVATLKLGSIRRIVTRH